MTKTEFLETLRSCLDDELPIDKVNDNINYYDEYINMSIAKGKNYDAIFGELGDPRLIAKTIIDTYKLSKGYQYKQENNSPDYENNAKYSSNSNDTYRQDSDDKYKGRDWNVNFGFGNPMTWYQKLIGILIVILVIFVVITLGSIAINLFFTIGIPILFAYLLYKLIINMFHRKY